MTIRRLYRSYTTTRHAYIYTHTHTHTHTQLDEKDMGLDNYQTPSGGYVPSNPNRTKHMGRYACYRDR